MQIQYHLEGLGSYSPASSYLTLWAKADSPGSVETRKAQRGKAKDSLESQRVEKPSWSREMGALTVRLCTSVCICICFGKCDCAFYVRVGSVCAHRVHVATQSTDSAGVDASGSLATSWK